MKLIGEIPFGGDKRAKVYELWDGTIQVEFKHRDGTKALMDFSANEVMYEDDKKLVVAKQDEVTTVNMRGTAYVDDQSLPHPIIAQHSIDVDGEPGTRYMLSETSWFDVVGTQLRTHNLTAVIDLDGRISFNLPEN